MRDIIMLKFTKGLMLAALSLMLGYSSLAVADCGGGCFSTKKTCNSPKNHPEKYVGVYFRSDVPGGDAGLLVSLPVLTLNVDGTAILYVGESLIDFVTGGTNSPFYGNWQVLSHKQVLVTVLGFFGQEDPNAEPPISIFSATRITYLLDFSQSLNSPTLIARSTVDLTGLPSSEWLNPSAGTLLSNTPITPRQFQRICAFASDLTRTQ
jgi:hypothetical protein